MTYSTEIKRHYETREKAHDYLASRGFQLVPGGWANGRWAATLEPTGADFIVSVWLWPANAAAVVVVH